MSFRPCSATPPVGPQTAEKLDGRWLGKYRLARVRSPGCIDVAVTPAYAAWAIRILDALAKAQRAVATGFAAAGGVRASSVPSGR